jgi:hypothetical protein
MMMMIWLLSIEEYDVFAALSVDRLKSVKAALNYGSQRGGKKDNDDESSSQSQRNDSNTFVNGAAPSRRLVLL